MDIFKIMDRESSSEQEVYLYEEGGKWFAYGRSAALLKSIVEGIVKLKNFNYRGAILEMVEVDLLQLLNKHWLVALCADSEMILLKND